jgi:hypothetical protein
MKRVLRLLVTTVFALTATASAEAAWAATPTDPRVAAATKAWATHGLYVDPDFVSIADGNEMLRAIGRAKVPVFVAVVPTGHWFPEQGDPNLLAGRLAAANGKPGVYVVMDGFSSYGAVNQLAAYAPDTTYSTKDEQLSAQLADYLAEVKLDDDYPAEAARTEPLPTEPESTEPEERFTVRKAIGNGAGGGLVGLIGGFILGGIVLIVAALVTRPTKKGRK